MEITNTYYARNRAAWRKWLEKKHTHFKELWLIYYKKHTGKPCVSYNEAVEEALCFGWIDSTIKRIDEEKYAQKFTPRNRNSKWSDHNKRRVSKMIVENKMAPAGLKTIKGVDLNVSPVKPKHDQPVPDYFMEALRANNLAFRNFSKLAPSSRRLYLLWVSNAKKEETRQKRLLECMMLLEQGKKLPMK